jgi:peptidoglycan/LPS O-acetylase OafA/YrhL
MATTVSQPPRPPAPPSPAPTETARRTEVRPEIQALRAVAVSIVVIFHFWPHSLTGGYVGVDVFFAISGFLITSHLLREADRTGAVGLARFWARRARRILPAALLVLFTVAIVTIVFVPQIYWTQYFDEIRASTAYVQNWFLAHQSVNYLASSEASSPVQHFWSLSAEEQFYLVWPVLILLSALAAASSAVRLRRRTIAIVLGAVTLASFAYSIYDTGADPSQAYFITPTRAWEFGLGGLLALIRPPQVLKVSALAALSWIGLGMIMIAAIFYSTTSPPFPGDAALVPVAGGLAVIWAGAPRIAWSPTRVLGLRPIQFVGDVSYSVYLWHFPLLVLTPFVIDRNLNNNLKVLLIVLTVVLAWLTKLLVEDPVRGSRRLTSRKPRVTFALVALGMAVIFATTALGQSKLNHDRAQQRAEAKAVIASHPRCFGAASRDPEHPCTNPQLKYTVIPTPIVAADTGNSPCTRTGRTGLVSVCAFGPPKAQSRRTFALVGDSHAQMWRAGVATVASGERWRGLTVARTSCPYSTAVKSLVEPLRSQCVKWTKEVPQWFERHPEVSVAIVTEHNGGTVVVPPGQSPFNAEVAGYQAAWRKLPRSVKHIIVIRDTMGAPGNTPACIQQAIANHEVAGTKCAVSRKTYLPPDPAAIAQSHMHDPRVQLVDVSRFICSTNFCYPVVGGVLVLKDSSHLTRTFAQTLGPYVKRRIDQLMHSWAPGT